MKISSRDLDKRSAISVRNIALTIPAIYEPSSRTNIIHKFLKKRILEYLFCHPHPGDHTLIIRHQHVHRHLHWGRQVLEIKSLPSFKLISEGVAHDGCP